jgi:hypothetical protein
MSSNCCTGCSTKIGTVLHTYRGRPYCSECFSSMYLCVICNAGVLSKKYINTHMCKECYVKLTGINIITHDMIKRSTVEVICFYKPNNNIQKHIGPLLIAGFDEEAVGSVAENLDCNTLMCGTNIVKGFISSVCIGVNINYEYDLYNTTIYFAIDRNIDDNRITFADLYGNPAIRLECKILKNNTIQVNVLDNIIMRTGAKISTQVDRSYIKMTYFDTANVNPDALEKVKELMIAYKVNTIHKI